MRIRTTLGHNKIYFGTIRPTVKTQVSMSEHPNVSESYDRYYNLQCLVKLFAS